MLYQIYHEGITEDDALAALDKLLTNGTLKTPTVAGLAFHLRERGVVSCPDKKAAVDHILLTLIRYRLMNGCNGIFSVTLSCLHSKLNPDTTIRKPSIDEGPPEVVEEHKVEVAAPVVAAGLTCAAEPSRVALVAQ